MLLKKQNIQLTKNVKLITTMTIIEKLFEKYLEDIQLLILSKIVCTQLLQLVCCLNIHLLKNMYIL